jgi:hypothetical protein
MLSDDLINIQSEHCLLVCVLQQGWACPACTYINQPIRPGCEICACDRPADYEIPSDYKLTEEERNRMELDALIERKTREVNIKIQFIKC